MTAAFCTITDIANFLQVAITEGNASTTRAITEASAAIQNYCKQTIEEVIDDEITLDIVDGQAKIFLPELPVYDVAEVVEDEETLVVDDDYKLGQHGILHRIDAQWTSGIQIVTITYSHGYDTGAVEYSGALVLPEDIKSVCVRMAARSYQAGLSAANIAGVPGIQARSIGDFSEQFAAAAPYEGGGGGGMLGASAAPILLPSEKRILDKYRMCRP
ncbi:MAG: hypothetical protein U1E51_30985 [Candidatus Binatia bacterium]|nr:hypothetical protein [Candidatus Binatia bacterium]